MGNVVHVRPGPCKPMLCPNRRYASRYREFKPRKNSERGAGIRDPSRRFPGPDPENMCKGEGDVEALRACKSYLRRQ